MKAALVPPVGLADGTRAGSTAAGGRVVDAPGSAGRRLRVSVFVHDLAGNPVVRAAPLVQALAREFEVQVLGLLLSGDEVYAPYRGRFAVHAVRARASLAGMLRAARDLAAAATGDVLYACKPLPSTLLPALLARRGRPVLLDVEDDERVERSVAPGAHWLKRAADPFRMHAALGHLLAGRADAVTVASRALQRRYPGTLLRHGPDEAWFDPARPELGDRAALRRSFGLPEGRRIALFAGVPRPHKGWQVLLDALAHPAAVGWDLACAGPESAAFDQAGTMLGDRCHVIDSIGNERMPGLLAAVDAVPVPQLAGRFSEAQLPAKALEAMAMRVPVVASTVGDLPEVLGGGTRGWLVPPGDAAALAAALAAVAADPADAEGRTREAREWFLAEASVGALHARLSPLVRGLAAGRRA